MRSLFCLVAMACAVLAGPSAAQSAWQTIPSQAGAKIAASQWGDGTSIVARCDAGVLTAYVGGRIPMAAPSVFVMMERRGDDPFGDYWRISESGLFAFAKSPASFIRILRKGGTLDLVVKSRDATDREATLNLPEDATLLDEVLGACGESTDIPPRSLVGGIEWSDTKVDDNHNYYPPKAFAEGVNGIAALQCQAQADGRLKDCIVIDEAPSGYLFGQYAAAMIEREMAIRLSPGATGPLEGRWLSTTAPFSLGSNRQPRIGAPRPGDGPPPPLRFVARIKEEALPLLQPETPVP